MIMLRDAEVAVLVQARRRRRRRCPDLAESDPQISEDGKTVTVKIKPRRQVLAAGQPRGDVQGRQVRDRARLLQHRQQRLRGRLLRRPRGREGRRQAGHEDHGHHDARRPDDRVQPQARGCRRRRSPARSRCRSSAPVPEEYAEKFDKQNPSTYGENQVATGPYMIENDAVRQGDRLPGRASSIHLVRNPNWDKSTGLQAGLPGRDRHPAGQRRHRRVASRKHPRRRRA